MCVIQPPFWSHSLPVAHLPFIRDSPTSLSYEIRLPTAPLSHLPFTLSVVPTFSPPIDSHHEKPHYAAVLILCSSQFPSDGRSHACLDDALSILSQLHSQLLPLQLNWTTFLCPMS